MRAIGLRESLPIEREDSLLDLDLPEPVPGPHDLLVEVRAIAVNPVDFKMRLRSQPKEGAVQVLGWDAAGVVRAVGADVAGFAPGDAVWYAGALDRPGANAELHVVDHRIASRKPTSLGFAEAAALPLTAITAWEMLFDRFRITAGDTGALLVIGGAGGVGSIAIQLARARTAMTVIGTASRPETQAWVRDLGAHHVIDHAGDLVAAFRALGIAGASHVFSTTQTDRHWQALVEIAAPQGAIGAIDDPDPIDVRLLKRKALSFHWEFMFTRTLFGTPDLAEQGRLLAEVARLVDAGALRTTLGEHFGTISAANLRRAHALLETGRARGKIVLEGWGG